MALGLRYINRNLAEVVRHAALAVARRKHERLCDVVEGEGTIDVGLQLVQLKETLEFSETFLCMCLGRREAGTGETGKVVRMWY